MSLQHSRTRLAAAVGSTMFLGCLILAPAAFGAPNDRGDADGDGMSNYAEFNFGTDPDHPDTDRDGLIDPDEVHKHRTNPRSPDTDGDGHGDLFELNTGSDPLVNENPQPPGPPEIICTVTSDVDVYDVPGGEGNVIGTLRGGTRVQPREKDCPHDDWAEVVGPNVPGGTGWVWGHLDAKG